MTKGAIKMIYDLPDKSKIKNEALVVQITSVQQFDEDQDQKQIDPKKQAAKIRAK